MKESICLERHNLSPFFKKAQKLYDLYSILHTNSTLGDFLYGYIGSQTKQSDNGHDIRKTYNEIIMRYYPNEMSVKSNFINYALIKPKDHVTIFELPVGHSRVDLCTFCTSSIAYEIKTDLDNLNRLNKQIEDYSNVFEKVYVICSINRLQTLVKKIRPFCGIYAYSISESGNYRFKHVRHAVLLESMNPNKQLDLLRKQELMGYFNVRHHHNRLDISSFILDHYSPKDINITFKNALKDRYQNQWDFLRNHSSEIFEIDYQWFFKNTVSPELIYS